MPQIKPAMTIATAKGEGVRLDDNGELGTTLAAMMVLSGWREPAHDARPTPVFRTTGEQIFKRFSNGW
jgi:hypothetical protein